MLVVTAEILVHAHEADRFETVCAFALRHVTSFPGCRAVRLTRSTADPSRFLVISEWISDAALFDDFYPSEHFVRWRAEVSGFFLEPPRIDRLVEIDVPCVCATDEVPMLPPARLPGGSARADRVPTPADPAA